MSQSPFQAIRAVDYTVIFARDMTAMRRFYEDVMQFSVTRELSANWVEYRLGPNTFVLSRPGHTAEDAPIPTGTAALQLAFKVSTVVSQSFEFCCSASVSYTHLTLPTNREV